MAYGEVSAEWIIGIWRRENIELFLLLFIDVFLLEVQCASRVFAMLGRVFQCMFLQSACLQSTHFKVSSQAGQARGKGERRLPPIEPPKFSASVPGSGAGDGGGEGGMPQPPSPFSPFPSPFSLLSPIRIMESGKEN